MKGDLPAALKPVNAQEIDTKLHGRLGVPDGGALVQHDAAGLLELGDDGARRVAGCLDDLDALVDDDLGIGVVVGGHKRREQRDVDTERLARHGPAPADLLAQPLRLGENERRDDTQAARVGHGTGHLGGSDMLVASVSATFIEMS